MESEQGECGVRGNVNDSKRVSPYDLNGIAKLSGKPVSLTDSLSHSRRTPKELLERIASLESQLAEAKADLANTREAWNECENTLADAKARLAGYEVGYDPKVRLPKHDQWILVKHMNDDLDDAPRQVMYDSGDDGEDGVKYYPFSEDGWVCWTDITRWFPLPSAPKEEDE